MKEGVKNERRKKGVEESKRKVMKRVKRNEPSICSTLGQTPGSTHLLLVVAKATPVLKIQSSWTQ